MRSTIKSLFALAASGFAIAGLAAQTSTSSSASGNASVTSGQAAAGANVGQSAQTPDPSASVNASGQVQEQKSASGEKKTKQDGGSGAGAATSGSAGASGTIHGPATLSAGTTLQAELAKSVDAKNAKPGDEVTARLTQDVKADGKVVLHRGAKLIGHVTQAQAHTKEHADSQLGIVFDKALLKGGEQMSFNGVIRAVAPPVQTATSATIDESSTLSGPSPMGGGAAPARSAGGGLLGGTAPTATGAVSNTTSAVGGVAGEAANGTAGGVTGATGGLSANGTLTAASRGVIGLQGLSLSSANAGSTQGSVISSTSRNVKLDSGTQMVLQVAGAPQ